MKKSITEGLKLPSIAASNLCSRCRKPFELDWKFCIHCGNPLQIHQIVEKKPSKQQLHLPTTYVEAVPSTTTKISKVKLPENICSEEFPQKFVDRFNELKNKAQKPLEKQQQARLDELQCLSSILELRNAEQIEKELRRERVRPPFKTNLVKPPTAYLDDSQSVVVQYEEYVAREKELHNLASASLEKLDASSPKIQNAVTKTGLGVNAESDEEQVSILWNIPSKQWSERMSTTAGANLRKRQSVQSTSAAPQPLADSEAPIMFWSSIIQSSESDMEETNRDEEGSSIERCSDDGMMMQLSENDSHSHIDNDDSINVNSKKDRQLGIKVHSYSIISRLYYQSCLAIKKALKENDAHFKDVRLYTITHLSVVVNRVNEFRRVLAASKQADAQCQTEFELYRKDCSERRAAAAMKISERLEKAARINEEFAEQYRIATVNFELRNNAPGSFISSTGRHINSDATMDSIKRAADKELSELHVEIEELEREEAELLKLLSSSDITMVRTLETWRPKHAQAVHDCQVALIRMSGIRDNTAARTIQAAAKLKLLMYFRKEFTFRRNIHGLIIPSSVGYLPKQKKSPCAALSRSPVEEIEDAFSSPRADVSSPSSNLPVPILTNGVSLLVTGDDDNDDNDEELE